MHTPTSSTKASTWRFARPRKLGDSSLVARTLGDVELGLYAAPAYVKKYGVPASQRDLADHACVVFRGEKLARNWPLFDGGAGAEVEGRVGGRHVLRPCHRRRGGGIGVLPSLNCVADEAAGRIVRVLSRLRARGATLYLLHSPAKNLPARVTVFRD